MCYNIYIIYVEVNLELNEDKFVVNIIGLVNLVGRIGVEMELLIVVIVVVLIVYDMCKVVLRDIVIFDIKFLKKFGGKSGDYVVIWICI